MIKPIPLGTNSENMPQAVFVAIVSESKVWKHYQEISKEDRETLIPLVLMLQQWDGLKGFVGGEVEEGESLTGAVLRECVEEIGLRLSYEEIEKAKLVSSHQMENLVTHLMVVHVSPERMTEAVKGAARAEHFMSETVAAMPVHFFNYEKKRAFNNFIQNNFACSVKEEISDLISALGWHEKYGLPIDFVSEEMTQKGLI